MPATTSPLKSFSLSSRILAFLLLGSAFAQSTLAQPATDLRVNDVRFSLERSPYGGERWLEMAVMVDVRNNDRAAANPEFVDNLTLDIAVANNAGNSSQIRLEYFWTRIEVPTLKRGNHRFRFYLSPEQVERGRMNNDEPYAWYVQITPGAPPSGSDASVATILAVSQNLREQPRLDRFLTLLEEQKDARAGLLLPQAETPFRDAYPGETPAIKGMPRGE